MFVHPNALSTRQGHRSQVVNGPSTIDRLSSGPKKMRVVLWGVHKSQRPHDRNGQMVTHLHKLKPKVGSLMNNPPQEFVNPKWRVLSAAQKTISPFPLEFELS